MSAYKYKYGHCLRKAGSVLSISVKTAVLDLMPCTQELATRVDGIIFQKWEKFKVVKLSWLEKW